MHVSLAFFSLSGNVTMLVCTVQQISAYSQMISYNSGNNRFTTILEWYNGSLLNAILSSFTFAVYMSQIVSYEKQMLPNRTGYEFPFTAFDVP